MVIWACPSEIPEIVVVDAQQRTVAEQCHRFSLAKRLLEVRAIKPLTYSTAIGSVTR